MKFPSFSRDSWLIAIMGVSCLALGCCIGYYFRFVQTSSSPQSPNSPAPATSPSASPSSQASSPPTSPPAPKLPLLDELQSNLSMLNSKLEAVIKALGGVNTELTPEQLRLAWTNVDAQVDQLCTNTVSPLKQQIEQQSNKDKTYETIVDLFSKIEVTCNNTNRKTDLLKASSQPSSDSQQTVANPETNIKQELQKIQQLLNQVKEWVGQEQEKKYREGLDKRLDFQQNLQYSILGLLLVLLLGLFITVVLYKKGDRTVDDKGIEYIKSLLKDKTTVPNAGSSGVPEHEALLQEFKNIQQSFVQDLKQDFNKQLESIKTEVEQLRTISSSVSNYNNEDKNYDDFIQKLTGKILEGITACIENTIENKFDRSETSLLGNIKNQHNSESSLSTDFSNFSNNFDASQQQVQNQISNLSQEITSINSSLSTISTQLTQLTQSNDNSAATSAQKNNEVEELRLQLEQIKGEVEQLEITIQELESEKSQSQAYIQQLNTTLQVEKETIRQLQSDLEEKQKRLDSLEKQIEIKHSKINSLQSENSNAKQKDKAEETKKIQNQTQVISEELQSLVNNYNQNNGDLNFLNDPIPVKDNSDIFKDDYKLEKTHQDNAKFYIVSCQDKHYLFPKLTIPSEAACGILRYHFEVPQINTYPVSIKLIQPSEVKQMSEKDNWELVNKHSKGKVK